MGLGLCGMAAAPLRAPGRRGHRDAGHLVADPARLRRRGARPAPGPRRPGRHRHHQLDPADPAPRVGDPLPDARLVVTGPRLRDRCGGALDVPDDRARTMLGWDIDTTVGLHFSEVVADDWVDRSIEQFAEFVANPGSVYTARLDFRAATASPCRSRSTSSATSRTAICRRSTASPATSPSASGWSTTSRPPRHASGTSSRRRRTSSTAATPTAGSCSWPRAPRRSSAGPRPRSRT